MKEIHYHNHAVLGTIPVVLLFARSKRTNARVRQFHLPNYAHISMKLGIGRPVLNISERTQIWSVTANI